MTDTISQAKDRYEKAKSSWSEIYDAAREDLRFRSDDKDAQWEESIAKDRRSRGLQVLTLDQSSQFIHQVINDIRQNTPSINVIPDGEHADKETADEFKGIIRGIEYDSNADAAYDMAAVNSVSCGIGFIRVDHEYASDNGFEQKLVIKRVVNPLAVYLDPDSVEVDGRDANWGFVVDKIKVSEFKKLYPGKNPVSFEGGKTSQSPKDDEEIIIAEYFCKHEQEREIAQLESGEVVDYVEGVNARSKRKVSKVVVKRQKISGEEVLEETTFPGKYIPLIPVYGEEAWQDGKRKLHSLIRKAKPGQYLYNLWRSIEADMLLRAQRAPVIAPEGATEAFAKDYKDPDKAAVLRYTPYDSKGNPLPAPTRLEPPPIPAGIVNAAREMVDDIKASMGMYSASIGAKGNETSGIAIQRRQAEGDVATLHFGDNLNKSVAQCGRVLVSAIPEIYDTQRILPSIDGEDNHSVIGVNGALAEGQEQTVDLKKGQYIVRVTTGASYTTKRQEAADFFSEVVTKQPELMQVAGDLLFKNMDFPGAPALAERLKKTIPGHLLEGEDGAPEVDPEKQQMAAQIQEMQQALMQMQQQLESKQSSEQMSFQIDQAKLQLEEIKLKLEAEKIANDRAKTQIDAQKAQTDQFKAEADAELRAIELKMQSEAPQEQPMEPEEQEEGPDPMEVADKQMQAVQVQAQLAGLQATIEGMNGILQAMNRPKQVVRDENGLIAGVQ